MKKLIFGTLIFLSATSWAKLESVTFGELRPRLLIQATENLSVVHSMPEIMAPNRSGSVNLTLSEYNQKSIKKGTFYRVSYVAKHDAYGSRDGRTIDTVYKVNVQELDKNLQPTSVSINLGAKALNNVTIGNFLYQQDKLSDLNTLETGRARIGDHVINSEPVILNNEKLPAYSRFEVIGIFEKRIDFTLTYEYRLRLRDVRTGRLYDLEAPGYYKLSIWAHDVAKKNERIYKLGPVQFVY